MKKNNKTSQSKKVDLERETRVLLEEIRHSVKTVAEGHSILVKKLEEHDEKLNEMDDIIRKIDSNYFKLQMDTQAIKSQTGTIDIKVDRIEKEVGAVKNVVMETSSLTKIHETRITKLEEKVLA